MVLRNVLTNCGYGDALISEDFPIWVSTAHFARPDLVAFSRRDQKDMTTSAIVASVVESEDEIRSVWLDAAAALAAPALVVALPTRLSVWKVAPDATRHREIASSSLNSYGRLTDRLESLSPHAIQQWKQAGVQASLFPISADLLQFSRAKAREELTATVERALISSRSLSPTAPSTLHPRLVIAAIAALMIRDKMNLSNLTGGALIDAAQQRFPSYFGWMDNLHDRHRRIIEYLANDMSESINFAGLEPAMVSDVYEQAMLDDAQRRNQGSYYTPPALARAMLDSLPFETIPPEDRYILDPACGSGTLLLASVSRLQGLEPSSIDARASHQYVVNHLRGIDIDPFAVEIAKLTLLMTALPIGNSWQIDAADALNVTFPLDKRPSIIVSNPPWKYKREDGRRQERANDFLAWMLDALRPGGLLGCILPVSWLNSATSRENRRSLLDSCDLMDVWQLPEETFSSHGASTAAPTVLIAQKRRSNTLRRRVLVKRVAPGPGNLASFYDRGTPSSTILVDPGPDGANLLSGPISEFFLDRAGFSPLGALAEVRSGCAHAPNRVKRDSASATHFELASARDLRAFGGIAAERLVPVRYPDDFHRVAASDKLVKSKKVLVSAKRSAESPYRFKVGVDLRGVVPRETFYMIRPVDSEELWNHFEVEDRLFAVMAAMGSGLATAWVVESEPKRNISSRVYRDFPLPSAPDARRQLSEVGRRLYQSVESGSQSDLEDAVGHLEGVVSDVYELSSELQRLVAQTLGGFAGPEGVLRYQNHRVRAPSALPTSVNPGSFGTVLGVSTNKIQVWVSGVTDDEGEWIGLPPRAPGSMMAEGKDFIVSDFDGGLTTASFGLHQSEWVAGDRPSAADLGIPG